MGAKENTGARNTREALILAGLEELNEYGIQHFSTRRVAKACGMSCAAPYKHFKDSHEFIAEILGYINRLLRRGADGAAGKCKHDSAREQLVQVSMHYIRFLTEHPAFRRIVDAELSGLRRGIPRAARADEHQDLRGRVAVLRGGTDAAGCAQAQDVHRPGHHLQRSAVFRQRRAGVQREKYGAGARAVEREFDLP